ncbi:hypothetical protein DPMN_036796 [Dreissena polymorpha]|uniref:Uncharacterized protein n=1 Tax=Dreissena polymorpha TaxID=45954 RepID=A0A9D4MBH0_DREPO|nr:hypothetical protein DPMN_036796 [Dreissena polymorpha]
MVSAYRLGAHRFDPIVGASLDLLHRHRVLVPSPRKRSQERFNKPGLGREGDVGDIFAWDIIMSPLNYMKEKLTSPSFFQQRRFISQLFHLKILYFHMS